MTQNEKIAVVGLGYVGLPVALSFAKKYPTIGFDISQRRIDELKDGIDVTNEVTTDDLKNSSITLSADPTSLKDATFVIVAVPTPIDANLRPNLTPVLSASRTVGENLQSGAVVVYESTVYPGVTEDICVPELERVSSLQCGKDFFVGYSPERINPGDKEHTFERIIKVVSGQDGPTLERVAQVYESVVTAGVHRAANIKVAEAAKVIENTQRDLNISLMNELSRIFDLVGIRTKDVLEAAGTKWNFLPFTPGLVGGHCIGVDPYYLTTKAEELGYQPQVILAGRRINNDTGNWVAQKTVKLLARQKRPINGAKVAICGLTFKEDVPDLRNSRVPDIIAELNAYGISPLVHDPLGDPEEAKHEYGVDLCSWDDVNDLDAMLVCVSHDFYIQQGAAGLAKRIGDSGVFVDVKSVFHPGDFSSSLAYWSL